MSRPLFTRHASTLRAIIEAVGVPSLRELTSQPGVRAVFRVTVHHHDGRARDTVATLIDRETGGARLELVIRLTFGERPLFHPIPEARYEAFTRALQSLNFDRLPDQPDLPPYGADLWLLERAAGTFTKSLILAPTLAEGAFASLANAIYTHLSEALREVS